jgi:peptide/nickel transport system substrate-binding protein
MTIDLLQRPARSGLSRGHRLRKAGTIAAALALGLTAAACSSSGGSAAKGHATSGGIATFAEAAGDPPDYIFPLYPLAHWDGPNTNQLQPLLWRPLYFYGTGDTPALNQQVSIAYPPVYTDSDRTVTIKLKPYVWSDGKPVTSRDVEFWMNLLRYNSADFGPYVPGTFPDDVSSADYPNASTVVFHLDQTYNPSWFTNWALSMITPLPQHAWDKTSASGAIGNYDETKSGAAAVYKFLNSQSSDPATFATNPLWQTVDGPWKLQQFTTTGKVVFVPNKKYSGPVKPRLSEFVELPFTSATAEYNAVRSGAVDYGYLPFNDVPQEPALKQQGYNVVPWTLWGVNYLYVDYGSSTLAATFKQLYIRQAMQHLINQQQIVTAIYSGDAYPTYGPVPVEPANDYASAAEKANPYPYNPKLAMQILSAHGWTVPAGGEARVCSDPAECGAGIAKGTVLKFSAYYPSGTPDVEDMMQAIQSSFQTAGIAMTSNSAPTAAIGAMLGPTCKSASCWGLIDYGTAFYFQPAPFPDGGSPFGTGAVYADGYSDPQMNKLIAAVRTTPGSSAIDAYETYAAAQLPGLWIPQPYSQLSVIKNNLQGTTPQNVIGNNITPENWYFSSGS